jgi:hypothetical protein
VFALRWALVATPAAGSWTLLPASGDASGARGLGSGPESSPQERGAWVCEPSLRSPRSQGMCEGLLWPRLYVQVQDGHLGPREPSLRTFLSSCRPPSFSHLPQGLGAGRGRGCTLAGGEVVTKTVTSPGSTPDWFTLHICPARCICCHVLPLYLLIQVSQNKLSRQISKESPSPKNGPGSTCSPRTALILKIPGSMHLSPLPWRRCCPAHPQASGARTRTAPSQPEATSVSTPRNTRAAPSDCLPKVIVLAT